MLKADVKDTILCNIVYADLETAYTLIISYFFNKCATSSHRSYWKNGYETKLMSLYLSQLK